jgi:Derlin-2/3
MASLEQWIKDFPVITRTYMAGALLTTAACALDLLSPFSLYFSLPMILQRHQYWRLVTNFFFFGANFSLDFLFHMFFLSHQHTASLTHSALADRRPCLTADCVDDAVPCGVSVRYCRALEEGSFRGRTADFFFLILFGAVLMTVTYNTSTPRTHTPRYTAPAHSTSTDTS